MKLFYQFISIFFLAFLFSCQQPQQPQQTLTETENDTIKKDVKNQFNQLVSALNQKNVDLWSLNYSDSEFISAIVSTDYYSTRTAFKDSITKYISMRESQHIEHLEIRVTPLTPVLAFMTSEEKIEILLKNGQNFDSKHVFTMIWKKEKDGWKILHSHESWTEIEAQ